jgi:hypothetical protein
MDYLMILQGMAGGLAVSLAGFSKSGKKESFDWLKFGQTLIVSAIIGGIAAFTNQDYGLVANSAIAAGITGIVENLGKALFRKISEK